MRTFIIPAQEDHGTWEFDLSDLTLNEVADLLADCIFEASGRTGNSLTWVVDGLYGVFAGKELLR